MAKLKLRCDVCNAGPFEGERGLQVHNLRKHTERGKAWGPNKGIAKQPTANGGVREIMHEVLQEGRAAMRIQDIVAAMQKKGYRPSGEKKNAITYVGHLARTDESITRTERGVFRMKTPRSITSSMHRTIHKPSAETPVEAPVEAPVEEHEISRDALLVRIETLVGQNTALRNAHIALLGITHA